MRMGSSSAATYANLRISPTRLHSVAVQSSSSSPLIRPFVSSVKTLKNSNSSSSPAQAKKTVSLILKNTNNYYRSNWEVKSISSSSSSMADVSSSSERKESKKEIFETEEVLSVALAKYTADLSEKFVKERGAFTVVVSGGSLIKSLRKLVEAPYVDSIDWARWHVFWVDERVVPKDHEDSNYKLAYDGFLSKVPIPPGQVYAINDALPAEGAADDYETCLKHLVNTGVLAVSTVSGFPKFDVQLLGMGPDGHVASLFPGHPLVNEKQRWVTFIKDSPKPPPERITFTFPVINSSAYIALVVAGAGKAEVVKQALGNVKSSNLLPVQMVSAEDEMTWFLDNAAASKL